MAPHIEVHCQAVVGDATGEHRFVSHWEKVFGTEHRNGDIKSRNAKKAHDLLVSDPNCREVGDKKGEPCTVVKKSETRYGGL